MDINMESIGGRVKARRKELQLTQTDIFKMCGIRSGALSRIENGTSVPSIILFYKIAEVLNCDINWLVTGVSSNIGYPIPSNSEITMESIGNRIKNRRKELHLTQTDIKSTCGISSGALR